MANVVEAFARRETHRRVAGLIVDLSARLSLDKPIMTQWLLDCSPTAVYILKVVVGRPQPTSLHSADLAATDGSTDREPTLW